LSGRCAFAMPMLKQMAVNRSKIFIFMQLLFCDL